MFGFSPSSRRLDEIHVVSYQLVMLIHEYPGSISNLHQLHIQLIIMCLINWFALVVLTPIRVSIVIIKDTRRENLSVRGKILNFEEKKSQFDARDEA